MPAPAKAGPTLEQQRARVAWLFVAPMLVAVALVAAWPLARTIAFSFTDAYLSDLDNWQVIGIANYVPCSRIRCGGARSATTLLFAVTSVGLETLLGLVDRAHAQRAHAGARTAARRGADPVGDPDGDLRQDVGLDAA